MSSVRQSSMDKEQEKHLQRAIQEQRRRAVQSWNQPTEVLQKQTKSVTESRVVRNPDASESLDHVKGVASAGLALLGFAGAILFFPSQPIAFALISVFALGGTWIISKREKLFFKLYAMLTADRVAMVKQGNGEVTFQKITKSEARRSTVDPIERAKERYVNGDLTEREFEEKLDQYEEALLDYE